MTPKKMRGALSTQYEMWKWKTGCAISKDWPDKGTHNWGARSSGDKRNLLPLGWKFAIDGKLSGLHGSASCVIQDIAISTPLLSKATLGADQEYSSILPMNSIENTHLYLINPNVWDNSMTQQIARWFQSSCLFLINQRPARHEVVRSTNPLPRDGGSTISSLRGRGMVGQLRSSPRGHWSWSMMYLLC